MSREADIRKELARLGRVALGLEQRYGAHFALHKAACMTGDRQEVEQRCDELHTLLDALLDNAESVQRLIDEQDALTGL